MNFDLSNDKKCLKKVSVNFALIKKGYIFANLFGTGEMGEWLKPTVC